MINRVGLELWNSLTLFYIGQLLEQFISMIKKIPEYVRLAVLIASSFSVCHVVIMNSNISYGEKPEIEKYAQLRSIEMI